MDKYILTYNKEKHWYIAEMSRVQKLGSSTVLIPAALSVEQLEEIVSMLNKKAIVEKIDTQD